MSRLLISIASSKSWIAPCVAVVLCGAAAAIASSPTHAVDTKIKANRLILSVPNAGAGNNNGNSNHFDDEAEARLLHVVQLLGLGQSKKALTESEALLKTHPNFQLAQLVHGDVLNSLVRPIQNVGDVPAMTAALAPQALASLRDEILLRIKSFKERPQAGTLPSQFLNLSARNKHAIAVDASRSRLYLFENTSAGAKLLADYYISVGQLGVDKQVEGDMRTPLGVYFISSNLDPKTLLPFYGIGALPLNYPNSLDTRRGKTGSGIWLHGTPSEQYSRSPKASNGCVVLANPDLKHIIATVSIKTTPVVIASRLDWVSKQTLDLDSTAFAVHLENWRNAKSRGNASQVMAFYTNDFSSYGKNLALWNKNIDNEIQQAKGKNFGLSNVSLLAWRDKDDTMIVTFDETLSGSVRPITKRQYWTKDKDGKTWKIFFEGMV